MQECFLALSICGFVDFHKRGNRSVIRLCVCFVKYWLARDYITLIVHCLCPKSYTQTWSHICITFQSSATYGVESQPLQLYPEIYINTHNTEGLSIYLMACMRLSNMFTQFQYSFVSTGSQELPGGKRLCKSNKQLIAFSIIEPVRCLNGHTAHRLHSGQNLCYGVLRL